MILVNCQICGDGRSDEPRSYDRFRQDSCLGRRTQLKRRNVTVDWEGVEAEKRRTLKQARGNAKRGLTVALKQISDALLAEASIGDAEASKRNLV